MEPVGKRKVTLDNCTAADGVLNPELKKAVWKTATTTTIKIIGIQPRPDITPPHEACACLLGAAASTAAVSDDSK